MLHAKEKLNFNINIPVLIIQPSFSIKSGVFRIYTATEREQDVKAIMAESLQIHSLFANNNFSKQEPNTDLLKQKLGSLNNGLIKTASKSKLVFFDAEEIKKDHSQIKDEEDFIFVNSDEANIDNPQSKCVIM